MLSTPPNLPDDKEALKALVAALARERDELHIENLRLQIELDGYKRFAIIGKLNIQRGHTSYMHHFWSSGYTVAVALLSEMVRAPRS